MNFILNLYMMSDFLISNFIPRKEFIRRTAVYTIVVLISLWILPACKSSKNSIKQEPVTEMTKNKENKKDKEKILIGEKIAREALTWQGTPYKYGHSEKGKCTDCSGLVMVVFLEVADMKLPRNSAKQAEFCETLKEKEVRAGDLVFFATGSDKNKVSHVGVMLDGKRFVHASSSKGVVVSDMDTPYFIRTFKKYGRVPIK